MKSTTREPDFAINNSQKKIHIKMQEIKKVFGEKRGLFSAPPEKIGVTIVSDKKIKPLNRKFFKKNLPTDVMSFKISRKYGDIVISAETALRNSLKYGFSLEKEIIYLIVHGYLHLKNYKDYNDLQRKKMMEVQDGLFNALLRENS